MIRKPSALRMPVLSMITPSITSSTSGILDLHPAWAEPASDVTAVKNRPPKLGIAVVRKPSDAYCSTQIMPVIAIPKKCSGYHVERHDDPTVDPNAAR